MADLTQAYTALRNADAAGDHAAAAKIADYIKSASAGAGEGVKGQANAAQPVAGEGQSAAAAPTPTANLKDAGKQVAASTVAGGVLGAFAPEIMSGLGVAAAAIPVVGEVLGPALFAAGRAMRTARVAEAAAGALSGAVSETAGQVSDAAGGGKATGLAVRLGAGMLSPGAGAVAGFVSKSAGTAWKAATALANGAEASIPKAVAAAREKLSSAAVSSQPQVDLHAVLADGVAADTAAAEAAARAHIATAHEHAAGIARTNPDAAQRVIDDARAYGDNLKREAAQRADVLDKATAGKLKTAAAVKAKADGELLSVGTPKELSDIGNSIRGKVTAEQQKGIEQRAAAYKQQVAERDAVVAEQEAKGKFIDAMPQTRQLKEELSRKLLNTKAGRESANGKATVTDPGTMMAYQKVYDAVSNRRVQTGTTMDGSPTYQTFKTTFEALDAVRRKLGDAAFGKEAEGYGALGQGIAKDLYAKIARIQEQYAGPAQEVLQSGYAEGTDALAKFGTATGKKLTAVDRMDPEAFMKDPATIPAAYFRSQQGVKDLLELTGGDHELVHGAAKSYVARQLEGKSSAQVEGWLKQPANRDWMREVPGLQGEANAYARKLQQIERVSGKLEGRAAEAQKERGSLLPKAQSLAEKEMEAARKEASARVSSRVEEGQKRVADATSAANTARDATVAKAAAVVKEGFPAEATRKLLTQGTPEELRTATRYLAAKPGGAKVLADSVRSTLRDMPEASLRRAWSERVLPMLRDGGLVQGPQLQKLTQEVEAVLKAYAGKEKVKLVGRMVATAMTTAGGMAAAGGERLREGR